VIVRLVLSPAAGLLIAVFAADLQAQTKKDPPKEVRLDVPYVPTPQKVVEEMLKLGGVKEGDVVYDLGCGDGRIVVTAVKAFHAKKGLGLDIDPQRIAEAKKNAKEAKVEDKVEFREADILKLADVSEASVVTLYLLPEINEKLKPMLRRTLKPGSRVVSHDFDMGDDWKPEKEMTVRDGDGRDHTIYLWTIPAPRKGEPKKDDPKPDEPTIKVPYVPTPQTVVEEMLKLGGVKDGDVVYDLGCGDGRIVVTAVKSFKAKRGVGVDIDPERIKESKQAAKEAKVEDKVEFRQGDVLKITDVSDATVVCLYLFPEVNERLKPMLQRTLKPGSRVVSHDFLMGDDWKPEKEVNVRDADGQQHTLYLWTIKDKKK
jgi:ubiquinone/menaquinone biosynthesis C-methylase UbiE